MKIYEVFESAQSYYLIMDLIKGRNLHDEMEILKVDLYYSVLVKKLTTRVSYYKDYNDSIVERIKFTALKWGKINSIKNF